MPATLQGSVSELIANLRQASGRAVKTVNDGMQESMQAVQREAIARAPMEFGNLERAIKLENGGLRRSWSVYIDPNVPGHNPGTTVGDYAGWLHEDPTYQLGRLSLEKPGGVTGPVGPKYLEDPFRQIVEEKMLPELQARLTEELAKR